MRYVLALLCPHILLVSGCNDGGSNLELVKTFQGTGDMETTSSFEVSRKESSQPIEFEIRWVADEASIPFSWGLHFSSVNASMITSNAYGAIEGTEQIEYYPSNQFSNTATFVFDILAEDDCSWKIEVWK